MITKHRFTLNRKNLNKCILKLCLARCGWAFSFKLARFIICEIAFIELGLDGCYLVI